MEKIRTKLQWGFVVFGTFLLLLPSIGLGQTTVNCPGDSLQSAIASASSGTTISVTGTCNENISTYWEKLNITLDGGGTATINGPDSTRATVTMISRYFTIKGFNITGGFDGIQVVKGGNAIIDGNTIQSGRYGIVVAQNSFAQIINNTIQSNPTAGIVVSDSANAYIGVNTSSDTEAKPNNIQSNAVGIIVASSSSSRIIGNTISNNTSYGVQVVKASQADIANNTINGNGQDGIFVAQNSGVNLGKDTGTTIFDLPNSTTVNNGGKGLRCVTGGYAEGRLGTLNGAGTRPTSFSGNCINSLTPSSTSALGAADVLVPGDYDGDGKTDIAVWRPGEGYWYIINSKDGSITSTLWGAGYDPYNDKAVPGDYDGDGKTDIAIWRAADGYWYIINSWDGSITATQWGTGPD